MVSLGEYGIKMERMGVSSLVPVDDDVVPIRRVHLVEVTHAHKYVVREIANQLTCDLQGGRLLRKLALEAICHDVDPAFN